jgi:EAL domain-containing protein (putative c-di-GMP-specific phosphodiesterase class I)
MLRAGASGYVGRSAPPEQLVAALKGVVAGDSVFDDVVAHEERAMKQARILSVMQSDDLEIVYQPIVALESRTVVGYEALSRFRCEPERPPDQWFAEAHQVGLGVELEMLAVRMACERSAALPDDVFMAVNVSPPTAERQDLLGTLAAAQVDHVMLEVTEHARVADYPQLRIAIGRLRELGARLAVDDAGAGFASWRHVLELDADLIKLDGSLTKAVDLDPRRSMLASALVDFGRQSGAAVLAEHIESEPQLAELRRLGVRYGQGFHLGRPQADPVAA